ncbi:helix-turn-helix transcriptional regulator [Chitinophaga polysaccharea]|uniref:AraC family transcriptional regulator n=1 Tax=Chitinophaga TaxID=79328 RepID=UPI0014551E31|nr:MULTISPECIES: AraC family transcriptional regulator [Chitinophaga]NLR56854.1 helix-turn-helix transcriptional regulator [Chitinophaga polysaccharea]NLU93076.1 helix-turn-helix transcriptional regulator [Chitinophaga sp. Ak27]
MKHLYESFIFPADQSFTVRTDVLEMKKYNTFKSHVNYEIALLENCSGKRFIGDHIGNFEGPELVLLGSYLPHCWQYQQVQDTTQVPMAYVVHFLPDFLGKELLAKPEARELNQLFSRAARGISFSGETAVYARFILQQMLCETGLGRMAWMMQLLHVLARSKHFKVLSSRFFNLGETSADGQKINRVFDYIYKNFKDEITLPEVANLIHMSPSGFCRFFKLKTNKTLIDVIKEIRINYAAKLLLEGMANVSEACYTCGYNNISNFNKHFKEVKGLAPRNFIRQYQIHGDDTAI